MPWDDLPLLLTSHSPEFRLAIENRFGDSALFWDKNMNSILGVMIVGTGWQVWTNRRVGLSDDLPQKAGRVRESESPG